MGNTVVVNHVGIIFKPPGGVSKKHGEREDEKPIAFGRGKNEYEIRDGMSTLHNVLSICRVYAHRRSQLVRRLGRTRTPPAHGLTALAPANDSPPLTAA